MVHQEKQVTYSISLDNQTVTYPAITEQEETTFTSFYDVCSNYSLSILENVTSRDTKKITWKNVLDPRFFDIVPKHWLQFEPPTPEEHVALGILYIIILIPALIGNFMIIWLYFTSKPLRTPSNILVVNLAIADLFMNVKMPLFIYNSFYYGPITGEIGCKIYGFLGGLSGTCAIMTIAAMSAERYVSISRPLNPSGRMTTTRALLIAAFIWLYSGLFSSMPLLGINRYVPEGFLTSCSFDYLSDDNTSRIFVVVFFAAAFCVPLTIICYSYCGIVVAVRRSERCFRGSSKTQRPNRGKGKLSKNSDLRLAKIAFTLISIWLISWTPYATLALMGIFSDRKRLTPMTSMVPALFAKTSSVFNPFVYSLTHPRFKSEINRRFFWWRAAQNSLRTRVSYHSSASQSFGEIEEMKQDIKNGDLSNKEGYASHEEVPNKVEVDKREAADVEEIESKPRKLEKEGAVFTISSEGERNEQIQLQFRRSF